MTVEHGRQADNTTSVPDSNPWNRRRFLAAAGATTAGALVGAATFAPAASASPAAPTPVAPGSGGSPVVPHGTKFADAHFRATHNSYSGNLEGMKGPILQQLDW